MEPDPGTKSGDRAFFTVVDWFAPIVTEIEATDADDVLGSVTIERRFAKPGVHGTPIAEGGIVGFLYGPGDGQRHQGVIVLGGSEGGFGGPEAAMLASHGFTALSLAYFGVKGLPPTLQNIPIEYFAKAVRWMRTSPIVDADFIAMYGTSRGAEAALMVAATYPEIKAIVAKAPSNVRWEGVTAKHLPGGAAWTFEGKPLPYVPNRIPFGFLVRYIWDSLAGIPVPQTPLFLEDLAGFGDTAKVEIPVEQINGPVLLLSGQDDQIWPSALMAGRVMDRLRRNRYPYGYDHLSYEGAGHWLPAAYVPMRGLRQGMKLAIGGTPDGTARAQADSWPKILDFLISASAERHSR
jgi:pimeloyl-ACP methyl ester carboxylesterase